MKIQELIANKYKNVNLNKVKAEWSGVMDVVVKGLISGKIKIKEIDSKPASTRPSINGWLG